MATFKTPSGVIVDETMGQIVPDTSITAASLAPASSPNFQTTPTPSVPDISGIDTTLQNTATQLTPQETEVQKRLQDIQTSQNALLGKTAFTRQEETKANLPELQKVQQDLAAQIKGYQLESQNLQNQYNYLIPNQKIQELTGRASVGGIQGETEASRRFNLLKQGEIASKALTASAAFEAARGNLAFAQQQVDRAVAAKYGPEEEKIKVAMANLDLLLKDPALGLAERNRALAQQEIQTRKAQKIATDKETSQNIFQVANEAAKNGADTYTLQRVQNAKTAMEALQIASSAGVSQAKIPLPASAQEYEYAKKHGYTGTYTQYQNEDANRKIAVSKAGATVIFTGPTMGLQPNQPDPKLGGLSQNALDTAARNYLNTGTLPSLGLGQNQSVQLQRMAILNRAGELSGGDPTAQRLLFNADKTSLANLTRLSDATNASATTASHNLDLALIQSPKVGRTDAAYVNSIVQKYQSNFTQAKELTQFEVYIYTAAREYAKVTSGSSASVAGLSDSAAKEATKLLNAAQSPESFRAAVEAMKADMANVTSGYESQRQAIEARAGGGTTGNTATNIFDNLFQKYGGKRF